MLLAHALCTLPPEAIGAVPQVCRAWRDSLKLEAETVDRCIQESALARFPGLMTSSAAWASGPVHRACIRELYEDELSQDSIRRRFNMWKRGQNIGSQMHSKCYLASHCKTRETSVLKIIRLQGETEGIPFVMRLSLYYSIAWFFELLFEIRWLQRLELPGLWPNT